MLTSLYHPQVSCDVQSDLNLPHTKLNTEIGMILNNLHSSIQAVCWLQMVEFWVCLYFDTLQMTGLKSNDHYWSILVENYSKEVQPTFNSHIFYQGHLLFMLFKLLIMISLPFLFLVCWWQSIYQTDTLLTEPMIFAR